MESDPAIRGRPVVLQSKDGHALWVSQKILDAMAPIPAHVEGGHIVRDDIGNPTGEYTPLMPRDQYCLIHHPQAYSWIMPRTWFPGHLQPRSNSSSDGQSRSRTRTLWA